MRGIESRIVSPRVVWPTLVWVLIGTETLVILWFHMFRVPVEISLGAYLWQCEALFGSPRQQVGIVPATHVVNILAGLGLWIAFRSARSSDGPLATAILAATLLGATVLASINWWGLKAQEQCRPLEIRGVYQLDTNGSYKLLPGARADRPGPG